MFDVSPDQVAALDDEGLRLLIARLCQAELRRRGLPMSAVLYGGNQIAADGGIDVRVELPADTDISGFVPRPATGFQAKADDMPASEIEKEMRPKAKQPEGATVPLLRPSIRALAETGGAYVIVGSKGSTADSRLIERRNAMRVAVADLDCGDNLHVDFYDRTRLADWVNEHPGEVLWLRERLGQPLPGWRPLGNWSRAPDEADPEYLSDDIGRLLDMLNPQDGPFPIGEGIARLRSLLAVPGGIARLTGLSGTGKTRLLEALFDTSIGAGPLDPSWAIYADVGVEAPHPSIGQLAEQLNAEGKRAILVLDNCPRETHEAVAPLCQSASGSLSLISVDLDIRDERPEGAEVFRLQSASETVIDELLARRFPAIAQAIRDRIAELSDGNARLPLLIAEGARHEAPDANLATLGDDWFFRRLFDQRKGESDELLRAAEALSLVYSFDGETRKGPAAELSLLARVGGLDTATVFRAVAELKRRDIIQSRGRWRAILPQPLGNWLARRALANLPAVDVANALWDHLRLVTSFAHRLSYLHDSSEAQRIAAAWLSPGGPLSDLRTIARNWKDLRMDLIGHLAPVTPETVLDLIECFVASCDYRELQPYGLPHRHRLISLLRKLAWFPGHFRRAALSLARFAQAALAKDPHTHDTGYFEELFWPVLSGCSAGPQERITVLEELLAAPDEAARDTGLLALRGMLRASHFSSSHDFSFGGRPVDFGWRPRTPSDYQAWFGSALAIIRRLAEADSPHKAAARSRLARSFRELWSTGAVCDELERIASDVQASEHWPKGWIAVRETRALDARRMAPDLVARLDGLQAGLAPKSLDERLRTFVLIPAHEISRLAHWEAKDSAGEPEQLGDANHGMPSTAGPHPASHDEVVDEARDLGRHCAREPALFESWWSALFGPSGYQSYWFGRGLVEATPDIAAGPAGSVGYSARTPPGTAVPPLPRRSAAQRPPARRGRTFGRPLSLRVLPCRLGTPRQVGHSIDARRQRLRQSSQSRTRRRRRRGRSCRARAPRLSWREASRSRWAGGVARSGGGMATGGVGAAVRRIKAAGPEARPAGSGGGARSRESDGRW